MINHEFELKLMLKLEEYERLRQYIVSEQVQTNYYFDNQNFDVYHHKNSLRIRQLNDQYEITVKSGHKNNHKTGVLVMEEFNNIIEEADFLRIMSTEKTINDYIKMEFSNLQYIGSLKTKRALIKLDENLPFAELDCNEYSGLEDFELEWEISEDLYDKAIEVLKKVNLFIDNRKVGVSKFVRFIKSAYDVD